MNVDKLKNALLKAGCNPNNFCIGLCGSKSDVFCLSEKNGMFSVYYSERGRDSRPIFKSRNESEACQFYFDQITAIEHRHLVGFFESDKLASELVAELENGGVKVILDEIPPMKTGTPKIKRVFVLGKDIFKAQNTLSVLPLNDMS